MRNIPAALAAHLQGEVTTLAVCWRVERSDGVLILGTEHDRDITIEGDSPTAPYGGTYRARAGITGSNVRSTSDMSVDNMEVEGAVNTGDLNLIDLSPADIEAGLFDDASVVLFLVNWQAPDDGQIVLRTGNIGAINRTSEGFYRTELRGLTQRLSQNFIRTYGAACDAELGDSRCMIDLAAITTTGVVTAVASNRAFSAELADGSPATPIEIDLFLPADYTIQVGDTFTLSPGCDKTAPMCQQRFNNLVNFRGHGFWVPGNGEMQIFGGQTPERGSAGEGAGSLFQQVLQQWLDNNPFPNGSLDSPTTPFYSGGLLTWTGGENLNFSGEVKKGLPP